VVEEEEITSCKGFNQTFMKVTILAVAILFATNLFAQQPDYALRTAWFTQNGSARNIATGGVMGSLGGDITANHVNPAGLGLFKTSEFVMSPGMNFNNNTFKYRGSDSSNSKNNMLYGTSGFVLGSSNARKSKWTSNAIAISINQVANYNNRVSFKGFNNMSSFSEQYLEELTRDLADSNAALSNYIFGSSLAFRTFLIDTSNNAQGRFDGYQSMVPISTGVNQSYDANTNGGYHELALGLAGNMEDKMYVGGSLTIPIINYNRELTYTEKDATNNPNNQFESFTFQESFSSRGIGMGLKLGTIYKPTEFWRVGVAFHTPQIIGFKDEVRASMIANTESYARTRSANSNELNSGNAGESVYTLITPWRATASASYVFREVKDTRKQRAFLSGDIEYVNYKSSRFSEADQSEMGGLSIAGKSYYQQVNDAIKETYRGNFNIKLGGEIKFHTVMFRLGGAYYGSPYADKELDASRMLATGGIGYRDHGIFIDLSYAHVMNKDVQFAYRLNDKPNTFAAQTGSRGTVMLTFGIKF